MIRNQPEQAKAAPRRSPRQIRLLWFLVAVSAVGPIAAWVYGYVRPYSPPHVTCTHERNVWRFEEGAAEVLLRTQMRPRWRFDRHAAQHDREILCVVLKPLATWERGDGSVGRVPVVFAAHTNPCYRGEDRRQQATIDGKSYPARGQILLYRGEREPIELPIPSEKWRERILEATLPRWERRSKISIGRVISELVDELRAADSRVAEMYGELPSLKP